MATIRTLTGDCLNELDALKPEMFDLIYLDPPFFTQKQHCLTNREGDATFVFDDFWKSNEEYARFLEIRLEKMYHVLAPTGSLFFHCDRKAVHIARFALDKVFSPKMFQSEIIWSYKRWSNASKGLLPAHQNILFYAKTPSFKFNPIQMHYSESTNLDQLSQKRVRDSRKKSVYARDGDGETISSGTKNGVPLGDVWDIPYLNPKAKERVGYPTQKPILLLERIITLCTSAGDTVLDPFCGSGTTLVASKMMGRNAVGIDISEAAINLTHQRLTALVKTESALLRKGRAHYTRSDSEILNYLHGLDCFIVQRNKGIDAILKQDFAGVPVFVRVQRVGESAKDAASALCKAAADKGSPKLIVILTEQRDLPLKKELCPDVHFLHSTSFAVTALLDAETQNQV